MITGLVFHHPTHGVVRPLEEWRPSLYHGMGAMAVIVSGPSKGHIVLIKRSDFERMIELAPLPKEKKTDAPD